MLARRFPYLRFSATAIGLALGLVLGLVWFRLLVDLPIEQRLRGDAMVYLRLALGFSSLSDALAYVDERSVGFPLTLYWLRRTYFLLFPDGGLVVLVDFIAVSLLAIHIAASLLFYFVFRRYARRRGVELHWALGAILLAYPGLVGYTTIPLTDTLCADLVIAGFAAVAWAADVAGRRKWVAAFAGGLLLGFAVLCRPSFEPAAWCAGVVWVAAIVLLPLPSRAGWTQAVRGRLASPALVFAAVFALGFAACTAPAAWHCSERFDTRCLMDPQRYQRDIPRSLGIGSFSPRMYWSRHADPGDLGCGPGCWALKDDMLSATWAASCLPAAGAPGYGLPACFVRRPDLGALFLGKKTLALFDSYHFQPYAVDITPRWARLWSRPFGAAAYAGFVLAFVLLVLALRDLRARELVPLLAFTLAIGLEHSLTHIEGRYSYGAVPGALLSLFWLLGRADTAPAGRRTIRAAAVLLALAFFAQTAAWDSADVVLQRIESALQ